ncbi:S-adenosyl-L-methionine-dependent methyltransferase [Irpex rosettiformis]|uniref:S-adenosyl-L-methionine-dependent methyltransferase n=1 Tax=Irpex rosettiformis TaxID=378272 RepID=A0ACB8U2X2_9APHY|nr:S-adenosyl-L-methionine-dependent methyltransferase [Irpex rosettiformis]
MSFRLPSQHIEDQLPRDRPEDSSSSSDEDNAEEETWEDWVSDSLTSRPCKSLFDDQDFPSVDAAVEHDKASNNFDLEQCCKKLGLDVHQRIRLINWIRKERPTVLAVAALSGGESLFTSDEYLIPVVEDDPLLQLQSDDWSDDDEDEASNGTKAIETPADLNQAIHLIRQLEEKLRRSRQDFTDYRGFVQERLDLAGLAESLRDSVAVSSTNAALPLRDDDSHYFQSYAENDIHAVMIQDKVRTATYASFIQKNRSLFQDAVVLDVGCGTGILSLFAARAGAKRVFAVDASDIAKKAEQTVKTNGLDHIITVIRGKVEEIKLPDDVKHVDVIISEWMGYALLYESMLDSVLNARDRFLRPDGGVMAPSQTQMMFALCDASEIYKERIAFWSDVYGFDLSAMAEHVYDDAVVDVVGPESLASAPVVIKDLFLREVTARQLDFTAPFTLVSTAEQTTKVHAFVLYFDTFFTITGERVPEETEVYVVHNGDPILAELWPVGGRPHVTRRMSSGDALKPPRPRITSFSTGPKSIPTHWKQTLFLLREPIKVTEGTVVQGMFKLRKSADNTRELDVEIHYAVREAESADLGEAVIQTFKVR